MSEKDDDVILICVRSDSAGELLMGSELATCSQCGCGVYIAPSGRALVMNAGAKIHCPECGKAAIEAADEATFKIAPGQLTELDHHFHRN